MGNFARYSPDGKTAAANIVTDCIAKCGDVSDEIFIRRVKKNNPSYRLSRKKANGGNWT